MTSASSSNRPVLIGASQLSHRNVNLENLPKSSRYVASVSLRNLRRLPARAIQ